MSIKLQIISTTLLQQYSMQVNAHAAALFDEMHDSALSIATFSFYISVSAVFSSRIEGEQIAVDSYIKHKRLGAHLLPDYTRKTDDLYDAYLYAQENKLTERNLLHAHTVITRHILQKGQQGKVRTGNMFVLTQDGRIEYVAATPDKVKGEMKKLYADISALLHVPLSFKETLYYGAMIHLVFVKIHPFEDGNGRTGRLLEKWFVAEKLGAKAWFVESEKYYYTHHADYYKNIRRLGLDYEQLDYAQALPFLLMLSASLQSC